MDSIQPLTEAQSRSLWNCLLVFIIAYIIIVADDMSRHIISMAGLCMWLALYCNVVYNQYSEHTNNN